MDFFEVKDAARSMVDNLFKTRKCKSFAVREDDFGDAILTLRFKRGLPFRNGQQTYVPPKQYTAYKMLNHSQNNRNRRRLENYYSNGRSKSNFRVSNSAQEDTTTGHSLIESSSQNFQSQG